MSDLPKALLKQFIRGLHDEDLLNKLRLEDKEFFPPCFPELLSDVRREESHRMERWLRHRKQVKAQSAAVLEETKPPSDQKVVKRAPANSDQGHLTAQLQQRIAELERQVSGSGQGRSSRPVRGYCYRCGQNGHYTSDCENPANKALVAEKSTNRREGQKRGN